MLGRDIDGVVGLPGVGFRDGVIDTIKSNLVSLEHVLVAFDADFRTNAAVRNALDRLLERLATTRLRADVITWDTKSGKGLDDALLGEVRT
jgi:Domain of unknown function (DUF3854)